MRSAGCPRWRCGRHHLAETHPLEVGDLCRLLTFGARLWGEKGRSASGSNLPNLYPDLGHPRRAPPLIPNEPGYSPPRAKRFFGLKTPLIPEVDARINIHPPQNLVPNRVNNLVLRGQGNWTTRGRKTKGVGTLASPTTLNCPLRSHPTGLNQPPSCQPYRPLPCTAHLLSLYHSLALAPNPNPWRGGGYIVPCSRPDFYPWRWKNRI